MRCATAQDAAVLLQPFFEEAAEERIWVLHLDAERDLIAVTCEGAGGAEDVDLPIAAILGKALRLGAAAVILAHNHPSGDVRPSEADLDSTRRLAEAARTVDLRVLDHLIFGGTGWSSLAALGLI